MKELLTLPSRSFWILNKWFLAGGRTTYLWVFGNMMGRGLACQNGLGCYRQTVGEWGPVMLSSAIWRQVETIIGQSSTIQNFSTQK